MAIFDRAVSAYDANKIEQEERRIQHEVAEAKRLADRVSTLLGSPVEPGGVRLIVNDGGRVAVFFFDHSEAHSGERLMVEMNCMRCLEKTSAEVTDLVTLGRLIVEGFHEGKCMPARADDVRRASAPQV